MWRGGVRLGISVAAPFVWRCLNGLTVAPFPHPSHLRQWCLKFGADFARRLRRRRPQAGDTWHWDEVFIRIRGVLDYLWGAVDQHGGVLDILVQHRAILPDVRHRTSRYLNTEDESSGRLTSTHPATRAADVDSYQPSFRWLAISYLATYLPSSPKTSGMGNNRSPCLAS
jgi:DDE domain